MQTRARVGVEARYMWVAGHFVVGNGFVVDNGYHRVTLGALRADVR